MCKFSALFHVPDDWTEGRDCKIIYMFIHCFVGIKQYAYMKICAQRIKQCACSKICALTNKSYIQMMLKFELNYSTSLY